MVESELRHRMEAVFTIPQVEVLTDWAEEYQRNLVKAGDFNELKEIVRDLAEAQKRTDIKMGDLAEAQKRTDIKIGELAESQKRTDIKMGELTDAQKRTEAQMGTMSAALERLADTQQRFAVEQAAMRQDINRISNSLDDFRRQEGSNAQTLGYMLKNEAYRYLPKWLKEHLDIEVTSRLIRQQIGDEEINLLADAKQGNEEILVVGESKSRLNLSDLGQLAGKIESVKDQYADLRGRRIVPVIITHFAPEKAMARAEQEGVVVVQSFEW
ncbi:MAG: hypothetical protein ABI977_19840 [Acidobacteriota bacterium]